MNEDQPYDWENPQVVGRNREPGHVTSIPYADEASALIVRELWKKLRETHVLRVVK